ncbi:MAG: hypothetical protein QOG19_982, partial [Mycobacterium sp.]|nr:hypothetical protein [Mycobacterium sp.]
RRRLTALVNAASLERREPAVYVIEDAHWIDEASESLLAEFLAVIPQTPSLVLVTYRPEYTGALAHAADAQTMALRPLNEAQASALATELLGTDPSIDRLAELVISRAAGNPFFAEEMVRDLAERGVLQGESGAYLIRGNVEETSVPATLQATIGARIDRLDAAAKRTLTAAAVIGSRFDTDLLGVLIEDADLMPLINAQLVNQVSFGARPEYAFRHPMIRTVAYESQLRSARAQLHRHLAAAIERRGVAEENAALIAEHLEEAGDLHAAFTWHMRAGNWAVYRDIAAAHTSWRRAVRVADRLSEDDPDRLAMRIEPRSLLCTSAFRIGGSGAETGFNELRELCAAAGDQRSLAIGMGGWILAENMKGHSRESSRIADELVQLLESIRDPTLTLALLPTAMIGKHDSAGMVEILRLAEQLIELAEGNPTAGNLVTESPLSAGIVFRGLAHACLGVPGWIDDMRQAVDMVRFSSAVGFAGSVWFAYTLTIPNGLLVADGTAERDTAAALARAEQSGDDLALDLTRTSRGVALVYQDGPAPEAGLELLDMIRERVLREQFSLTLLPIANLCTARRRAQVGDIDGAVELARGAVAELFSQGLSIWSGPTVAVLVESLLRRGSDADLREARIAIDQLAGLPTDPGYVLHEVWLLRLEALLAQAHGNQADYERYRDMYRARATELGFEGHIKWAQQMI